MGHLGPFSLYRNLSPHGYEWIDERFQLPAPDLPSLGKPDPETAAEMVRTRWELGNAPAPNMVHLLEAHGVRVFPPTGFTGGGRLRGMAGQRPVRLPEHDEDRRARQVRRRPRTGPPGHARQWRAPLHRPGRRTSGERLRQRVPHARRGCGFDVRSRSPVCGNGHATFRHAAGAAPRRPPSPLRPPRAGSRRGRNRSRRPRERRRSRSR